MTQSISFPSVTPNFSLPLLFAGQAQKEFFVNQSFALIDAMLRQGIAASMSAPPTSPNDGEAYRITTPAEGEWTGHEDEIAIRIAGAWSFIPAADGMLLFDRAAGQFILFRSGWRSAFNPGNLQGGDVVDLEARTAILELIEALRTIGILSES
ncbi:MAG: DUF2793 domain-containing protein [Pseudomonadota bacterium]